MEKEYDLIVVGGGITGLASAYLAAKAGKKVEIMSEAQMVSSGVVQLVELQENGYSYLRP